MALHLRSLCNARVILVEADLDLFASAELRAELYGWGAYSSGVVRGGISTPSSLSEIVTALVPENGCVLRHPTLRQP